MMLISEGGPEADLANYDLTELTLKAFSMLGGRKKVLIIPPDYTRVHSRAGIITIATLEYYRKAVKDILPAIGTHDPMTDKEINLMFPGIPHSLFREHNWRGDLKTLGRVPADFISKTTGFEIDYDWPAQVNRMLVTGGYDLIVSIGQVVPHEIVGMANHNKNIFIGTGGKEAINKSHYLGAVYGMEKIMGRTDTPVRRLLNYASTQFAANMPILYIQTVIAADSFGQQKVKGLFIGDDYECFEKAAELSRLVNITTLGKRIKRAVVYLPPDKNKSMWLGNKAIYRTRMAIEDGGELTVIAPGVRQFGEDGQIDRLIRKYGYKGTPATVAAVKNNDDLRDNLSAAAHIIHSSSEGRFNISYATEQLSKKEVESVGFDWCSSKEAMELYNPLNNKPGLCLDKNGEEFYLIKNASIGLWTAEGLG